MSVRVRATRAFATVSRGLGAGGARRGGIPRRADAQPRRDPPAQRCGCRGVRTPCPFVPRASAHRRGRPDAACRVIPALTRALPILPPRPSPAAAPLRPAPARAVIPPLPAAASNEGDDEVLDLYLDYRHAEFRVDGRDIDPALGFQPPAAYRELEFALEPLWDDPNDGTDEEEEEDLARPAVVLGARGEGRWVERGWLSLCSSDIEFAMFCDDLYDHRVSRGAVKECARGSQGLPPAASAGAGPGSPADASAAFVRCTRALSAHSAWSPASRPRVASPRARSCHVSPPRHSPQLPIIDILRDKGIRYPPGASIDPLVALANQASTATTHMHGFAWVRGCYKTHPPLHRYWYWDSAAPHHATSSIIYAHLYSFKRLPLSLSFPPGPGRGGRCPRHGRPPSPLVFRRPPPPRGLARRGRHGGVAAVAAVPAGDGGGGRGWVDAVGGREGVDAEEVSASGTGCDVGVGWGWGG